MFYLTNDPIKRKWSIVILVVILLLTAAGFIVWTLKYKPNIPENRHNIDLAKNPNIIETEWISGKIINKGGNYFDMDYKGMTVRVQIPQEGAVYLDEDLNPSENNFDSINVDTVVSVKSSAGHISTGSQTENDQKYGYIEASAIVIGEVK